MGTPSVGDVVMNPCPYSDLSKSKRRSALVLSEAGRGDFLVYQITGKQHRDPQALPRVSLASPQIAPAETASPEFPRYALVVRLSFLELLVI